MLILFDLKKIVVIIVGIFLFYFVVWDCWLFKFILEKLWDGEIEIENEDEEDEEYVEMERIREMV